MDLTSAEKLIATAQEIVPKGRVVAIRKGDYIEMRNDEPSMAAKWVDDGWTTYTGANSR